MPAEVFTGQPNGPSADLMLGFNSIGDGAYPFDEVRIGTTARSVLPIG